jgi:hypothetical protein
MLAHSATTSAKACVDAFPSFEKHAVACGYLYTVCKNARTLVETTVGQFDRHIGADLVIEAFRKVCMVPNDPTPRRISFSSWKA